MPTALEFLIRARDEASAVLEGVGEAGGEAAGLIRDNWMAATAVLATAGAGIEALARKQAAGTVQTGQLAARIGEQTDTVRLWATELSDAGFPLEDVVALMDLASKRGLEGQTALQAYAGFWDDVADASGESAVVLAEAGVGLAQIGIEAGAEGEALAALGFVIDNTSGGVNDFLEIVNRMGPDLSTLGLDINDTAALLGAMEQELGLTGRVARTQFSEAVANSDGTVAGLLTTLGLTTDQFEAYRAKVEESSGVVARNAEIEAAAHTPLEELQAGVADLAFEYGGAIQAASTLAPILIAAGPIAGILTGAWGLLSGAGAALTTVTGALSTAMAFLAANPIVLVIAAVAALGAGLVWLWNNSKEFRAIVTAVFERVAAVVGPILDAIGRGIDFLGRAFTGLGQIVGKVWDGIVSGVKGAVNFVIGLINGFIRLINSVQIHIPRIGLDTPAGFIGVGPFDWYGLRLPLIPSLAVGAWELSEDTLAFLHRGEMVVPAEPAEALRDAISGAAAPTTGPLVTIGAVYGILPGELERQTERAVRRATLAWGLGR